MTTEIHGVLIEKRLHTVDDFARFLALEENADRVFELIHGEIVEKVVTEEHGIIALNIGALIRAFVKPRNLGRVGVAISHRAAGDNYNERLPDVSFRSGTGTPVVKRGSVPHMPDLAIEIASPTNTPKGLRLKAEYMLQNGSLIVWLVYPERQVVEVCTITDEGKEKNAMRIETVGMDKSLDGGVVLPGFALAVRDIFDLE